jgi:hypothetical protein
MFPPIGAWGHVLRKRLKETRFVIIACPTVFDFEELSKYNLQGKHVLFLCTNDFVNVDLPEAHDLYEFSRWYERNVDFDGAYFCVEDKLTSFRLIKNARVTVTETDHPEYFGTLRNLSYSIREGRETRNTFHFCPIINSLVFAESWPKPLTIVVMNSKINVLVKQEGKSKLEIMVETAYRELGYYKNAVQKKTPFYINKKGHFSVHNAGRWHPEGEIVYSDGKQILSMLTGKRVTDASRMFLHNGNWLKLTALDISLLRGMMLPMFDMIIFLTHPKHEVFCESHEYILRRCARNVIVYRY